MLGFGEEGDSSARFAWGPDKLLTSLSLGVCRQSGCRPVRRIRIPRKESQLRLRCQPSGPGPALNAYAKSQGEEIRIIAGAANGGAALVVQPDANFKAPIDFKGKKIATPQLGNTQDISCRAWLASGGLKITQLGGDAQVLPTQNPDQLSLFQQKKIDAVWTVEPWVSRLETEAGGKVQVEEPDTATTVLVSSVKFLKEKRDLARKFWQAHRELTEWI